MQESRPRSWSRMVLAGAVVLAAALSASARPAAVDQTPRSLGEMLQRLPRFARPQPIDADFRLTRDRMRAIRQAVATGLPYVPGEVMVKFRPGVTRSGQARALGALRSRPGVEDLRWIGDVALVVDESQPDTRILIEQLSEQPEVEYAEPNYYATLGPRPALDAVAPLAVGGRIARTPSDPDYSSLQWNFPAIDLPRAWDINDGADSSVTIAVIDSGLTTSAHSITGPLWTGSAFEEVTIPFGPNPDLAASRVVSAFDFVLFAAGGPVLDLDGHGSHVAGTAAQQSNNGIGLAGIAYGARIMPVKVCLGYWDGMLIQGDEGEEGFLPPDFSFCPYAEVAAGIRYAADSGADVINISLGGPSPSTTLRDALQYAVSRGSFVSISMGNEFESGNSIGYPAFYAGSIDGVMAVTAVGRSLTRSYYSSTGSHAEVAAPGGSFRDGGNGGYVYQVTLGPPSDTSVTVPVFDRWFEVGYQGTSMAAPHVAGAAALLMSQMPTLGPANVERLIKQTARPCSTTGCTPGVGTAGSRTNEFGFGLLQPRAALFGRGIAR